MSKAKAMASPYVFCCDAIRFIVPENPAISSPHNAHSIHSTNKRVAKIVAQLDALQLRDLALVPELRDPKVVEITLNRRSGTLVKIDNITRWDFPTRYFCVSLDAAEKEVYEELIGQDYMIGSGWEETRFFVTVACAPNHCGSGYICRLMKRKDLATPSDQEKKKLAAVLEDAEQDEAEEGAMRESRKRGWNRVAPFGTMARREGWKNKDRAISTGGKLKGKRRDTGNSFWG